MNQFLKEATAVIEFKSANLYKPRTGIPVLLLCESANGRTVYLRGFYTPKYGYPADTYEYEGTPDYDEETDSYYFPEGFYEWSHGEDVHYRVELEVRAWAHYPDHLNFNDFL